MDTKNTTPVTPVTPETPVQPPQAISAETETQYQGVLNTYKEEMNPPIKVASVPENPTPETPAPEAPVVPTPAPEAPEIPAAPIVPPVSATPDYSNPEVAKSKLQEILNTPTSTPTENGAPVEPTSKNNNLKMIFWIVFLIFIAIAAVVAYLMLQGGSFNAKKVVPTPAPVETEIPTPEVTPETSTPSGTQANACVLNDKQYQVGETFSAADGCNICTCTTELTITCTERACTPTVTTAPTTTSATTPTKTLTPTKVVTPTKVATPTTSAAL